MPFYRLTKKLVFPHPGLAEEDGLLAIGGDLRPERLILAYQNGIFPWYNEGEEILWYSPNPRFVLIPENLKVSKSMQQIMRANRFHVTINQDFESVIDSCGKVKRKGQHGTWITHYMKQAYITLHQMGLAHSVEVWNENNALVGGLYGVNLGTVFFGESMFHQESNTSKLAFIKLVQAFPFSLIDCQTHTNHLESLGATFMSGADFYKRIVNNVKNQNLLNRNTNFVLNHK